MTRKALGMFDRELVQPALIDAFKKLAPTAQWRNPVMFVVWVVSVLTTLLALQAAFGHGEAPPGFIAAIAVWLWITVWFANFAEALAEGRSKAQAAALRGLKQSTTAKKLAQAAFTAERSLVPASSLRKGDLVLVEAGDLVQIGRAHV